MKLFADCVHDTAKVFTDAGSHLTWLHDKHRIDPAALAILANDNAQGLRSTANSLVGKRMVKKQQMRWSFYGTHMLMQVRTAALNGDLQERSRAPFRQSALMGTSLFKPKPPLLRVA